MTADEIRETARKEIRPGLVFKIKGPVEDGKETELRFRVIQLFPSIVLTEEVGQRFPVKQSFDYWKILKALGKIPDVNLQDGGTGGRPMDAGGNDKRLRSKKTRDRDLLSEKYFQEACERYAAGEISSITKAGEMCGISHSTFRKFYQKWVEQKEAGRRY